MEDQPGKLVRSCTEGRKREGRMEGGRDGRREEKRDGTREGAWERREEIGIGPTREYLPGLFEWPCYFQFHGLQNSLAQ